MTDVCYKTNTFWEDNAIYAYEQNFVWGIKFLIDILRNEFCANASTFVTDFDTEKSFDKINRSPLLCEISPKSVSGLLYNVIHTIYSSSNSLY